MLNTAKLEQGQTDAAADAHERCRHQGRASGRAKKKGCHASDLCADSKIHRLRKHLSESKCWTGAMWGVQRGVGLTRTALTRPAPVHAPKHWATMYRTALSTEIFLQHGRGTILRPLLDCCT